MSASAQWPVQLRELSGMLCGSVLLAVGSATTFLGPVGFSGTVFGGDLLHDLDGDLLEVRHLPLD